jgi:hypothetical protein
MYIVGLSGHRRPTQANESQRRPSTTIEGQRRLSRAIGSQQRPTRIQRWRRRPTRIHEDHDSSTQPTSPPTKTNTGQRGPAAQRRPTRANAGQRGPTEWHNRMMGVAGSLNDATRRLSSGMFSFYCFLLMIYAIY